MAFEKPTWEQLYNRFRHHSPVGDQAARYDVINNALYLAALECVAASPVSPEQTRAVNALLEARYLFHAAIAVTE